MPDLQRCVVQFIHPGAEHALHNGRKPWNTGEHRRKFLQIRGEYIETLNTVPTTDDLVFWGEWEPESEGQTISRPEPDGPHWVHRPYYVRPTSYPGNLQNTDPFVFGDRFLYTLCRQTKPSRGRLRPTFLRDLAPGSLVLFGSLRGGEFVLDTALVVADGVLHDFNTWPTALADVISETYATVTMRPTYQTAWPHRLRLYSGATLDKPFNGMFSFVPSLPAARAARGFARPAVRLDGLVTPGLMMGAKATRNVSVEQVNAAWAAVAAQVIERGLGLGVRFALPLRRTE